MKSFLTLIAVVVLLAGCSTIPSGKARLQKANKVASLGDLKPVKIEVEGQTIKSYQKLSEAPKRVRLYIEGDGFAYVTRIQPSTDPTPLRPIALELASVDPAPDVIYLARLCQYLKHPKFNCEQKYWTTHRYGANVYNLYMRVLNKLKGEYGIEQFDLVGFSGGGTIATLLAQARTDVASLRTVAGNLDIARFARVHNISPLKHSLNPLAYAERADRIEQMHFIGDKDSVIQPTIAHSYLLKQTGNNDDAKRRMHIVAGMAHDSNWQEIWPKLLDIPLE